MEKIIFKVWQTDIWVKLRSSSSIRQWRQRNDDWLFCVELLQSVIKIESSYQSHDASEQDMEKWDRRNAYFEWQEAPVLYQGLCWPMRHPRKFVTGMRYISNLLGESKRIAVDMQKKQHASGNNSLLLHMNGNKIGSCCRRPAPKQATHYWRWRVAVTGWMRWYINIIKFHREEIQQHKFSKVILIILEVLTHLTQKQQIILLRLPSSCNPHRLRTKSFGLRTVSRYLQLILLRLDG